MKKAKYLIIVFFLFFMLLINASAETGNYAECVYRIDLQLHGQQKDNKGNELPYAGVKVKVGGSSNDPVFEFMPGTYTGTKSTSNAEIYPQGLKKDQFVKDGKYFCPDHINGKIITEDKDTLSIERIILTFDFDNLPEYEHMVDTYNESIIVNSNGGPNGELKEESIRKCTYSCYSVELKKFNNNYSVVCSNTNSLVSNLAGVECGNVEGAGGLLEELKSGCPDTLYTGRVSLNATQSKLVITNDPVGGLDNPITLADASTCTVEPPKPPDPFPNNENDKQELKPLEVNPIGICAKDARTLKAFQIIGYIIFIMKIVVPLILIIMASLDFAKAVISSGEKPNIDVLKKVGTRIGIAVIIFIIPTVLDFLLSLVDGTKETMEGFEPCTACLLDPLGKCQDKFDD